MLPRRVGKKGELLRAGTRTGGIILVEPYGKVKAKEVSLQNALSRLTRNVSTSTFEDSNNIEPPIIMVEHNGAEGAKTVSHNAHPRPHEPTYMLYDARTTLCRWWWPFLWFLSRGGDAFRTTEVRLVLRGKCSSSEALFIKTQMTTMTTVSLLSLGFGEGGGSMSTQWFQAGIASSG